MGASLAFGVAAASAADGWIVALGDMPFVQSETVREVARRLREGGQIVVPRHLGRRGHPVGFGRIHLGELRELTGDRGARALLERWQDHVQVIDVEDSGVLQDIDLPSDLAAGETV
jgi:molybdenum cofactor cytidylyltransferase